MTKGERPPPPWAKPGWVPKPKAEKMEVEGPQVTSEHPRMVLGHKLGAAVTFELISEEGDSPNNKVHHVKTVVQGKDFFGQGRNKKLAYQDACEKALKEVYQITYDPFHSDKTKKRKRRAAIVAPGVTGFVEVIPGDDETEMKMKIEARSKTALSRLHEIKPGLQWTLTEDEGSRHKSYTVTVVVEGETFEGHSDSKKGAKKEAAVAALRVLEPWFKELPEEFLAIKSKRLDDQPMGITAAMRLNTLRPGLNWSGSEEGEGRNAIYTMTVTVDGQTYQGTANSKRNAKREACLSVLKVLDPEFKEGQLPVKHQNSTLQMQGDYVVTGMHPRTALNAKNGGPVQVVVLTERGTRPGGLETTVKVVAQGRDFYGTAPSKKAAISQACEKALLDLYRMKYDPALAPVKKQTSI